ncbi:MAG: alanine dehydrogenase [Gammaproteobacteria bacterium]|jgi:alanine dehydrogenase|nr:alanine dehydrogenase [Gammaproteobacteria bacterium]MDP6616812.1 alanine dehydrogenase [Gammaproteobacteria bacterium]MDP6695243.1 alanine dehydrogenase [Gammaproteobacteria bacterium]
MRIGVPKEIKVHEYRVGLVPAAVRELVDARHSVVVETDAGLGIGATDDDYELAGATILPAAENVFARADMIVKVKEPQPAECAQLRPKQLLFTYLHLAADPVQARGLCDSGATAIAYETITADDGSLPLLTPMSQVAGRMSIQAGAACLEKAAGGRGILLGGIPGVNPAKVVIIGGGVAGTAAAEIAVGMQADVTVLDISLSRLAELSDRFGNHIKTVYSTSESLRTLTEDADLVIGAVLIPGHAAPKVMTREMIGNMKSGSVVVDIAIDQGGCFETSVPTTHAEPTYVVDGVVHYCVANMPGAVPLTSSIALNCATLPFVKQLADLGWRQAIVANPHLKNGLTVHAGKVVHEGVAADLERAYRDGSFAKRVRVV